MYNNGITKNYRNFKKFNSETVTNYNEKNT